MQLANWTFRPARQPEGTELSFELRPLNLACFYELERSKAENGVPSFEGARQAIEHSIVGWSGVKIEGKEVPFSRRQLQLILAGTADLDWLVWTTQIAGELYRRALLPEDVAKNS